MREDRKPFVNIVLDFFVETTGDCGQIVYPYPKIVNTDNYNVKIYMGMGI